MAIALAGHARPAHDPRQRAAGSSEPRPTPRAGHRRCGRPARPARRGPGRAVPRAPVATRPARRDPRNRVAPPSRPRDGAAAGSTILPGAVPGLLTTAARHRPAPGDASLAARRRLRRRAEDPPTRQHRSHARRPPVEPRQRRRRPDLTEVGSDRRCPDRRPCVISPSSSTLGKNYQIVQGLAAGVRVYCRATAPRVASAPRFLAGPMPRRDVSRRHVRPWPCHRAATAIDGPRSPARGHRAPMASVRPGIAPGDRDRDTCAASPCRPANGRRASGYGLRLDERHDRSGTWPLGDLAPLRPGRSAP